MDELPIVHSHNRVLLLQGDCVAEVNGQLADVEEGVLVRQTLLQGHDLDQGTPHEVDAGPC